MQRSIRGAITVDKDTRQDVIIATKELLQQIIWCNNVNINDIVNIVFTVTTDIKSEFPTIVARELGLVDSFNRLSADDALWSFRVLY